MYLKLNMERSGFQTHLTHSLCDLRAKALVSSSVKAGILDCYELNVYPLQIHRLKLLLAV